MALCGFNQKMLDGLTAFNEGLVEHGLKFRTEKNDETTDQGIKREISDMARLLVELHRIDDSGKRIITEGLVKYAMGFYLIMRSGNVDDYKEIIGKICGYFKSMDEKYYSELEGNANDMKELATFLENIKII